MRGDRMSKEELYNSFLEKGERGFTVFKPIFSTQEGEKVIQLAKELESDGKIELREYGFQSDSVYLRVNIIYHPSIG